MFQSERNLNQNEKKFFLDQNHKNEKKISDESKYFLQNEVTQYV